MFDHVCNRKVELSNFLGVEMGWFPNEFSNYLLLCFEQREFEPSVPLNETVVPRLFR